MIKRNGLYILRKAKIPSTIVEVGYLSNKKDLKTIIKESGQNAIAQGISDGIIQALEEIDKWMQIENYRSNRK